MNRRIPVDDTRRLRNLRARARRYGIEVFTTDRQLGDCTPGHVLVFGAKDRVFGKGYSLTVTEAERIVTVEILRIRTGALKVIA